MGWRDRPAPSEAIEQTLAEAGLEWGARVPLAIRFRPEVAAFAEAMEHELQANDHKGDWKDANALDLLRRLREEVKELDDEWHSAREPDWTPWDPTSEALRLKWRMIVRTRNPDGSGGYETRPEVGQMNRLHPTPEWRAKILSEAADVANFAMMIADVCGALIPGCGGSAND
jgi:hypothetical protein